MLRIEKLSASSITTFDSCQMDFFCQYILNLPQQDRVNTIIGTAVHTFLEILAQFKLDKQNNICKDHETEIGEISPLHDSDYIADLCYDYYSATNSHLDWNNESEDKFYDLIDTALSSKYSPQNLKIIQPERYFKFKLEEFDWAHYSYLDKDGNLQKDCLTISGLIDLIYQNKHSETVFLDYKTGKPEYDWNKGKKYKYKDYFHNIQLCLYYYAITKLFPELKSPIVQIWFLQNNKVITLNFGDKEINFIINKIRKTFEAAKKINSPEKNISYKCKCFCQWGKRSMLDVDRRDLSLVSDGSQHLTQDGDEMMICEVIHKFVRHRGVDRVIERIRDGK